MRLLIVSFTVILAPAELQVADLQPAVATGTLQAVAAVAAVELSSLLRVACLPGC